MSLTSALYKLARASATGRAVKKGPGAVAKRQVRRAVYRKEGNLTRKVFRNFKM